jgi:hypothetical protein
MSLLEQIAYKTILGKSFTGINRHLYNEPFESAPIILGENVWVDSINRTSPSHVNNIDIVSEYIDLDLVAIDGTNNTSYTCRLQDYVPLSLVNKINPVTKNHFQPYDRIINLIPMSFGSLFRPRLYDSSGEVALLDNCNWGIDYFAGIISQQGNRIFTYLKAYIYTGKNINQSLMLYAHKIQFYDHQTIDNGIIGIINGVNTVFELVATPDANSEHIYINGILQISGYDKDYIIYVNKIIFNNETTPKPDDHLSISYRVTY